MNSEPCQKRPIIAEKVFGKARCSITIVKLLFDLIEWNQFHAKSAPYVYDTSIRLQA